MTRGADRLALAASPLLAVMALATAILPGDAAAMLCGGATGSALLGMPAMYLLMSLIHLGPWLRWIGSRRGRTAM